MAKQTDTTELSEVKVITEADVPAITESLITRLSPEEKDTVLNIFIQKEVRQKLSELEKKGKQVEATIEEYVRVTERRVLNRIVMQEVKMKVMGNRA